MLQNQNNQPFSGVSIYKKYLQRTSDITRQYSHACMIPVCVQGRVYQQTLCYITVHSYILIQISLVRLEDGDRVTKYNPDLPLVIFEVKGKSRI